MGPCESIITFEEDEHSCVEIQVRGPRGSSAQCFALLSVILDAMDTTIELVAPGMLLERHWLSPSQLREYDEVSKDQGMFRFMYYKIKILRLCVFLLTITFVDSSFLGASHRYIGFNRQRPRRGDP